MRSFILVTLLLIACSGKEGKPIDQGASGSGSSQPPTSGDPFDKAIGELEGYKTKMCACTDVLCTDKVFAEFTTFRADMRKSIAGKKPSKEQETRGNAVDKEMRACRTKVASQLKLGGSGSGSGSGSASADPIEIALADLDGFKTKMCACPDKACADKLAADIATWKRNVRAKLTEKPNALQEMKGKSIDKEIADCHKKAETATPGAPGGTSKIDNMLTQMQSFRDKLCGCTTKDCGDKIGKEMETWQQQAGKELADAKPTKDQDDKADRLQAEIKTCTSRLK